MLIGAAAQHSASGGFDFASLLLGALLALVAQMFLQLYIVPRVDARRRREDRWEEDVLAFGSLLTQEAANVISAATTALWVAASVRDLAQQGQLGNPDTPKQARERLDSAMKALDDLHTRMKWLRGRIFAIAPTHDLLVSFKDLSWRHHVILSMLEISKWDVLDSDREKRATPDDVTRRAEEESSARKALVECLEKLSVMAVPPRQSRIRARYPARALRKRLRSWRDKRREAR